MIACDGARRAGGSSGVEAGRSSESYTLTMQLIDMAKALVWLPFRTLGCASHAVRARIHARESCGGEWRRLPMGRVRVAALERICAHACVECMSTHALVRVRLCADMHRISD
jgi:hypothetical protein